LTFQLYARPRAGYQAGEYTVQVRTSDGIDVGSKMRVVLTGDNEVVDRRAMNFSKDKAIKKVDSENGPKKESEAVASNMTGDVQASGAADPFVPADAYNKTPEEEMRVKKSGCGCVTSSSSRADGAAATFLVLGTALMLRGSRRRSAARGA
jgi:hypothetical protein